MSAIIGGGFVILIAAMILIIGIADRLRRDRDEARDIANEAEDKAEHWHGQTQQARAAAEESRQALITLMFRKERQAAEKDATLARVLEFHERGRS